MTMEHIDRSFAVSLAIRHPSLDPGAVSAQLALVPKTIARVGEQRRTPKGAVLAGTYPFSFWSHEFQVTGAIDLAPLLEDIISRLAPHGDFLRQVVADQGSVELFCGAFADGNWDEILPHTLLRRLAEMHVDLRLDVYPSQDTEDAASVDDKPKF